MPSLSIKLLVFVMAPLWIVSVASAKTGARITHIRPMDPIVREALVRGYAESPTFRKLVDTLERSDVIVHVERKALTTRGPAGFMKFVARAGGYRYVRINLRVATSSGAAVALLGHELQHAVEVARETWVVDSVTCLELYHDIGEVSCEGTACFDTADARDAGLRVLTELEGPRASW